MNTYKLLTTLFLFFLLAGLVSAETVTLEKNQDVAKQGLRDMHTLSLQGVHSATCSIFIDGSAYVFTPGKEVLVKDLKITVQTASETQQTCTLSFAEPVQVSDVEKVNQLYNRLSDIIFQLTKTVEAAEQAASQNPVDYTGLTKLKEQVVSYSDSLNKLNSEAETLSRLRLSVDALLSLQNYKIDSATVSKSIVSVKGKIDNSLRVNNQETFASALLKLQNALSEVNDQLDFFEESFNQEIQQNPVDKTEIQNMRSGLDAYEDGIGEPLLSFFQDAFDLATTSTQKQTILDLEPEMVKIKDRIDTLALAMDTVLNGGNIPPQNALPVFQTISAKTIAEEQTITFAVAAADADNDNLQYSAENLPTGSAFANNQFTWKPSFTQAGNYQVTFKVSDGKETVSQQVSITVMDVVSNGTNAGNVVQSDKDKVSNLQKKYSDYEDDYYTIRDDLEETCSANEKGDLLDDLLSLEKNVKNMKSDISDLRSSVTDKSLKNELETLEDDSKDLRSKINDLQQNVQDYFCAKQKDKSSSDDSDFNSLLVSAANMQQVQTNLLPQVLSVQGQANEPVVSVVSLSSFAENAVSEQQSEQTVSWTIVGFIALIGIAILALFALIFV